jgi:hypothetical protein
MNAAVNRHTHSFPDGFFLSHAHPYDKTVPGLSDIDPHHHSEAEHLFMALISDPAAPGLILLLLSFLFYAISRLSGIFPNHTEPVKEYYQVHHYHPPPER